MANFRRLATALAAVIIGLAAYWYLAPRQTSFGMFEGAGASGALRFALTFVATIIGVILGSVYRELRDLQAKGLRKIENIKSFAVATFHSIDMWLGLAGSPIVYALLLQASDGMSLAGLLIVALQNGFCCLLILNGFIGKTEQQQTGSSSPAKT